MSKISESYIIGYDESDNGDAACLTVVKRVNQDRLEVVNTFFGKEAEELYEHLTQEQPAQMHRIGFS